MIASVKDEMQALFDVEYDRLNKAGKLAKISQGNNYLYDRAKRRMAEENALTVVRGVLMQNEGMRKRCEGIPVEWIVAAMKCPDPSIRDESIKGSFQRWAMKQMPDGLNDIERRIVFDWQFHVCEKEGRPWRKVLEAAEPKDELQDISEQTSPDAYIIKWREQALCCGYEMKPHEALLAKKAKESPECFSSNGCIGISYDSESSDWGHFADTCEESTIKMSVRGTVDATDMEVAAGYCRRLQKSKGWLTELDELTLSGCDMKTVDAVCRALSGFRVGGSVSVADVSVELDISKLSQLDVREISFNNIHPRGCVRQGVASSPLTIRMENCELGDCLVLDASAKIDELYLSPCGNTPRIYHHRRMMIRVYYA